MTHDSQDELFCSCTNNNVVFVKMRSGPDFPGLLLVFVEIMPDKVILDHKKSYLVSLLKF